MSRKIELSEFEMNYACMRYGQCCVVDFFDEEHLKVVKEEAAQILEFAKQELYPNFDEELERAYKKQDDVVYKKGYEKVIQTA